ncbi:MAG: type II toxin-antitoxin system RelE/ParE family toxin [Syntrophothermus sp.]|uniref:type II toxin-antitoxin system RelE/ParE family toxin n=1 Tax=Syntrophothermus sp. TaxID=2736299 RepID=UPI00257A2B0A|nr:type II toxin-antitoxin system RelE/ParE family toxin [Syntrophothermus sp.]NSW83208.1 type II toxin-antitoxin system RelE/ParE family toxin [Syntrophothermus sp.]
MRRTVKVVYPEEFRNEYIVAHYDFEGELRDIIERSGQKDDFLGKFRQRMLLLESYRNRCILKRDWFEQLKGAGGLHAMRFGKSQKNIRILFAFVSEGMLEYAVLLHAFEEKNGNTKGSHGYRQAIRVARERLKEVEQISHED